MIHQSNRNVLFEDLTVLDSQDLFLLGAYLFSKRLNVGHMDPAGGQLPGPLEARLLYKMYTTSV